MQSTGARVASWAIVALLMAMILEGCLMAPSFEYRETPEGLIEMSGSSVAFLRDQVGPDASGPGYAQIRVMPSRSVDDEFQITSRDLPDGGTEVSITKSVGEGHGWNSVQSIVGAIVGFLAGVVASL